MNGTVAPATPVIPLLVWWWGECYMWITPKALTVPCTEDSKGKSLPFDEPAVKEVHRGIQQQAASSSENDALRQDQLPDGVCERSKNESEAHRTDADERRVQLNSRKAVDCCVDDSTAQIEYSCGTGSDYGNTVRVQRDGRRFAVIVLEDSVREGKR